MKPGERIVLLLLLVFLGVLAATGAVLTAPWLWARTIELARAIGGN